MRYFIHLSFNGTNFCGWQRQINALSIQESIESALNTLLPQYKPIGIVGAGRTDSQVNASNFVAHFDIASNLSLQECQKLIYKLNAILSKNIVIHKIFQVSDTLHARFDAKKRTYKYYIHQTKNPFLHQFSYFFSHPLDIEKMNVAASLLLGKKDFTSMAKLHSDTTNNICEVFAAKFYFENEGKFNQQLVFEITANRFLRNMVRAIVGTLLEIGKTSKSATEILQILTHHDRCKAGNSVPGNALFLNSIEY